jgi:hypothetical protein
MRGDMLPLLYVEGLVQSATIAYLLNGIFNFLDEIVREGDVGLLLEDDLFQGLLLLTVSDASTFFFDPEMVSCMSLRSILRSA